MNLATPRSPAASYHLSATEAQWQNYVLDVARVNGWLRHAERPARRRVHGEDSWSTPIQGDAGYPDVTLVHPMTGLFLITELKSETGRRTPAQRRWGDALIAAGVDYRVWRPRDRQEVLATLQVRR